jgi:hypothetical protein
MSLLDKNDPAAWRRHFAMEANSRAWQLPVERRDRADERKMLVAAIAAIAEEQDRAIVEKTSRQVAAP